MTKREFVDTGTNKNYVRRDSKGRFKEVTDVGKASAADQRRRAKHDAPKGEGDKGDRRKSH